MPDETIRLSEPIRTPGGSRVTVLQVCVDVSCALEADEISVIDVNHSRKGVCLVGTDFRMNVASKHTGEAWLSSKIFSRSQLKELIERELARDNSALRRIIMRKAHSDGLQFPRQGFASRHRIPPAALIKAINGKLPIEEIEKLFQTNSCYREIEFDYTKSDGSCKRRRVIPLSVLGRSLRCRETENDEVKNFRIDRISNVTN